MRIVKVVGALLPLMLLASCGGDTDVKPSSGESVSVADQSPDASDSPSAEADPNLPSEETLKTYFNGIGHQTLDSFQKSIDSAVPGSPAAGYASYVRAALQAGIDGGTPWDEGEDMSKVSGGFRKCQGIGSDKVCYDYTDIEGADGKVSNFSVNGKPIGNRLSVGNGKRVDAEGSGASVTFIAAFESTSTGDLFVVLSVKAGPQGIKYLDATYRSTEGRQSDSSDQEGPNDLGEGAFANYDFAFPSAKLGGTLTLKIVDSNYDESMVTLKTR